MTVHPWSESRPVADGRNWGAERRNSPTEQLLLRIDERPLIRYIAPLLLVLTALLLGWSSIHFRPDRAFSSALLSGEDGNQLWRADLILRGKIPYRDFEVQYGFISLYLHAAFARVFGNTLEANRWYHLLASTGCIVLVYRVLERAVGPLRSLMCTLAFIPLLLAPGGMTGTNINVEYIPIERWCFLVFILWWVPPSRRSVRRAVGLGLTLGVWQALKFGGAFFAGLALLVVDLAWLYRHRALSQWRELYLRKLLATGLAFTLAEGVRAALIFGTVPSELALNAIFPLYMKDAYRTVVPGMKYPVWGGLTYFITQQLLPISCALIGSFLAYCLIRRPRDSDDGAPRAGATIRSDEFAWPLLLGLLFYGAASLGYFAHVHMWYQYCWSLLLAGAGGLFLLPRRSRALVLASWVPAWFLMLKVIYVNQPEPGVSAMTLPNFESIFLSAQDHRELDPMIAAAQKATAHGHFVLGLFGWGGGGFEFLYNRNYALRNHMLAPVSFQPSDKLELNRKLVLIDAVGPFRGSNPEQYLTAIVGPRLSSLLTNSFSVLQPADGKPEALIRPAEDAAR